MSMLSAQIDELRTMAAMFVVKGVPEVASVIRDAADTIWQLRDDLQRANAERQRANAERAKLRDENAMLRYVAENLAMVANDLVCDYCDRDEMLAKANEDLRSLGIEVVE